MSSKNNLVSSFKYYYNYLGIKILLILALGLITGVLDGLGLTMFLPLIQMASGDPSVNSEALGGLSFIVDFFKWVGININLTSVLLVMFFFFLLKGIATFISGYVKIIIEQSFIRKLRFNLIALLNKVSFKYFVQTDVGRVQNTMTGEVGRVVSAFNAYFAAFEQFILVLVYTGFAFFVEPKFALLITLGGLLTSFIYKKVYAATHDQSVLLTKNTHSFQGLIIQHIANFKYLKSTGFHKTFGEKLRKTVLIIQKSNIRIGTLKSILFASREPLLIFVVVLVVLIQTKFLDTPLSSILVSLLFFYRSLTYLLGLQNQWNQFIAVSGSMDNMTEFQEELSDKQETEGINHFNHLFKSIQLNDVSLVYGDQEALKDINLTISHKEVIAFVGASGSGKTSLINLITGLIPCDKGTVLVDGIDLNTLNKTSYQKKIGYITQDPVIFNDTVFNNVTLWKPMNQENLDKFHKVCRLANILDFIIALPDKEHTLLGNNGINISGGQRQRISIARELFKDIDILIMDEATSSLDSNSEYLIKENIESLKGAYTMIVVAHRLSTIKTADRIVMLKDGCLKFIGDFETLKRNVPDFARMVELQEL